MYKPVFTFVLLTLFVGGSGTGSDKKFISPPGTKPDGNDSKGYPSRRGYIICFGTRRRGRCRQISGRLRRRGEINLRQHRRSAEVCWNDVRGCRKSRPSGLPDR